MRLPEQNLWDRLQKNMPKSRYPQLLMERIENVVGVGTPDLHCIARGRVSWVELKQVPDWPIRKYTPVLKQSAGGGLDQSQKNWHLAYRQKGGRVATLIGVGSFEYVLLDGSYSDTANEMSRELLDKVAIVVARGDVFFRSFYDWLEGKIG